MLSIVIGFFNSMERVYANKDDSFHPAPQQYRVASVLGPQFRGSGLETKDLRTSRRIEIGTTIDRSAAPFRRRFIKLERTGDPWLD